MYVCVMPSIAGSFLFEEGKSDYSIVLSANASLTERTAANELQTIIKQMSGAMLPIVTNPSGKSVYVGWNSKVGTVRPDSTDESFTYLTIGEDLFIYGGSERGTMYGVFSFLERELGVCWYTSSYTRIPARKTFLLGRYNHTERPVTIRRLNFFYDALRNNDWLAHNLLNSQYVFNTTKYGQMTSYWGIHTFKTLINPSVYYKTHPEYFGVYKGRRSDKTQLCLSNKQMRKELTENLKTVIAQNPNCWCYDVSQNDNSWPCECMACERLVRKYGGQSGVMVWFVNLVAKEIKKIYPDKYIGTFAYRYTRQAPKSNIRPADNVVIRLCDIECCMAHPLEGCEQNSSFLNDMNDWRRICKNIYIWDYATGFLNYLLPFPNFGVLAANFRYFSRSNVIGIMEEGAHDAPWNEFSELKQWLVAKLMWNPNQDVDSLAEEFIIGYYGKAAPYVLQYYGMCKQLVTADTHFNIKVGWNDNLYTEKFISDGMLLMKEAIAVSGNDKMALKRVRRIAAQLYYLKLRRNTTQSVVDGTLVKFKDILDKDKTIIAEHGYSLDKLLKDLAYY